LADTGLEASNNERASHEYYVNFRLMNAKKMATKVKVIVPFSSAQGSGTIVTSYSVVRK